MNLVILKETLKDNPEELETALFTLGAGPLPTHLIKLPTESPWWLRILTGGPIFKNRKAE